MIHPRTELVFIGGEIGYGVVATSRIRRGTLVWVRDRDDAVFAPGDLDPLDAVDREMIERFGYRDHLGQTIVCADAGRYVNHACDATMRGVGPDAMIAVRDIDAGEELTCDYAECNLIQPLSCCCRSAVCRRRVGMGDLALGAALWQPEVERAIADGRSLPQPLLAAAVDRERIAAILAGHQPCPSLIEVELVAAPISEFSASDSAAEARGQGATRAHTGRT